VVDFFCASVKLVIEIDGGQHAEPGAEMRDQRRTRWLESRGYRVLRFWNNDVLRNLEGVWQRICGVLLTSPTLPLKGGGSRVGHA
jgi:very-short-patch-repair endonuclease